MATTGVTETTDPTDPGFRAENRIVFESQPTGFEHGFEQTVLSGPGLQLLNPSNRDSYQERLAGVDAPVSEVYQTNARWRRPDLHRLATDEEQRELRTWFLDSRRTFRTGGAAPGPQRPLASLPQPFGIGLNRLAELGKEFQLMYVADVVVVVDGWSWLLPAGGDVLVRLRRMPPDVYGQLGAAVPANKRAGIAEADCVLALCTVPWRVEVSHGARGYRNAILETGLLLSQTMQILTQVTPNPTVAIDFVDTTVDGLLDHDGVERFTSALIGVRHPPVPPAPSAPPAETNGGPR